MTLTIEQAIEIISNFCRPTARNFLIGQKKKSGVNYLIQNLMQTKFKQTKILKGFETG